MKVLVNGKTREISSVFDSAGQDITSGFLKETIKQVSVHNQSKGAFILKNVLHWIPPSEVMNEISFDKDQYSMSEDAFKWWEKYAQKHNEVSALEERIVPNIPNAEDRYNTNYGFDNEYHFLMFSCDTTDVNGFVNSRCKWLRNFAEAEKIDISDIKEIPYLYEKPFREWSGTIEEEKTMSKAKYTDKQVAMFQKFIRAGFDIEDVKNPKFNEKQLKELYLALKSNINISIYAYPEVSAEEMKELRKTAIAKVNLQEIAETVVNTGSYNKEQTLQILDAAKHGVSFKNMLNPDLDHLQMRQIKLGERYGIDTSVYATTDFSAEQMQRFRLELTVQKVIERIKEFFKERWDKILEWAKHKEITPEAAEEINDIVTAKSPKGIVDKLMSESALTYIAAKVYDKVSVQILEGEKNIENETVQSISELAEEASADIVQEQQEAGEEISEKQQPEVMVEIGSGKMPLREYQEMTAYQKGYDSYDDMLKDGESINEDAAYGNPPPEEEYFEAEEYLG